MASNFFIYTKKLNFYKKKWQERFGKPITEGNGIYVLTRVGEEGFRYAYVGQSKHVLQRLGEHMLRYDQHIDKSLRKHKIFSVAHPFGWKLEEVIPCKETDLDLLEHQYESKYAEQGYQLRNKTSGGQGEGKIGTDNNQGGLGYRKGVEAGCKKAVKELREYFDKYLDVQIKPNGYKKDGTVKELFARKLEEFKERIK